jgi:HK97 family phage major capsid protein
MATLTTDNNQGAFPNVSFIPAAEALPDLLLLSNSTLGPQIEGDAPTVRIPFVSEDADADFVDEGAEIPEDEPTLAELVVPTKKVATISVISREAYSHEGVGGLLTDSLQRSVTSKANRVFLQNPAPTEGQPATAPTGIAGYPGVVDGGTITPTDFGNILQAIATIAANGAQPTSIITGFDTWARILGASYADGTPKLSPDQANAPQPILYGLPVVLTTAAPTGTLLILDRSQILVSTTDVQVATSTERYFERDSIGVRVSIRLGFGILHPDRIAKLTIGE